MGIPMFYRWVSNEFPHSIVQVAEERETFVNGRSIPVDTTRPNPNGVEFDNLYIDMNNIIHPCFHPESASHPESYDEVFEGMFKYIDRLFSLIRPRKLLYVAIDGVAPRAKMNQQRARRFRTAKDAAKQENGASGTKGLDSNFITPGTEFMELLSSALQYYICAKMNNDPGWQGIKVILSDSNVPSEGEHKIMSYIRLQRNLPGFDPNTRHCLYGLDADLILLALATHEVHFYVLREVRDKGPKKNINAKGHHFKPLGHRHRDLEGFIARQEFQFINLRVLRENLVKILTLRDRTVKVDPERLIDDFVFMCVFVGNDFLPHLPSLDIAEGAMGLLIRIYKEEFIQMGGHLIDSFEVNMERVEHFLKAVGSDENRIFKNRRERQMVSKIGVGCVPINTNSSRVESFTSLNHIKPNGSTVVDKVNPGVDGWKERYYTEKFEVQTNEEHEDVKKHAVLKYVEGISWVMHYYYNGVCSWQWFYPYHYAPFASDFHGLGQLNIHFTLGKPFKPFNQLMGVLPASSGQALPLFYRKLMIDPSSPILDFYPTDFELEMISNRPAWQAICKLPFIDESRLLNEITKVQHTLTDEEKRRNSLGLDKLFVHEVHPLAAKIFSFSARNKDNPKLNKAKVKRKINPKTSGGMNGYIYISSNPICPSVISSPSSGMKTLMENKVLVVFYKFPTFHPHIPRPPKGVKEISLNSISRERENKGMASFRTPRRFIARKGPSVTKPPSMSTERRKLNETATSQQPSLQDLSSMNMQPSVTEPPPSTNPCPSVAEPPYTNTDIGDKNSRKSKREMSSRIKQRLKKRKLIEGDASQQPSVQDVGQA